MATITTRAGKGSPLTNTEVDANFTNLNADKLESTDLSVSTGAASGGGTLSYSAGVFTFAPADLSSYITDLSSFTTTDLTEGTNLYYTDERVDDRVNSLIQAGLGITTSYDDINNELTIESDTIEELCKNGTGSTILKGTPVYQTGTAGLAMVIAPADASSAATMPAVGVLSQDLAADAEGSLILMGRISGVNTSAFSEGDVIYVASGGGYTNTRPTGQSVLVQNLGRVTKVDASNGGGVVMGSGRANDVPNLTDGNVFIGNASGTYDKRAIVTADISDLTATAAEINTLDGITATTTELNYTDGVTSNIQTQLNAKLESSSYTAADVLTKVKTVDGSGSGLDADLLDGNHASAFATSAQGAKADSAVQDLSDLSITATAAEINTLDGITATTTELNYVDGVTSSIQTQLDGKEPADATILKDSDVGASVLAFDSNLQGFVTAFTLPVSDGTSGQALVTDGSGSIAFGDVDALPSQTGNDGYFLTTDGTAASWAEVAAGEYVYDRTNYTATSAQTTFSATYDVGYVDVFLNGVKLIDGTDFTATNGTSIVLSSGATSGDLIEILAIQQITLADTYTTAQADAKFAQTTNNLSDLASAPTALTNLGLTATAAELNYTDGVTSSIQTQLDAKAPLASPTFTGTVTATSFSGDGSALTGVDSLPSQTGNAGEFLTTDGTNPSWAEISASPTLEATASGSLANGDMVIVNADGTVSVVTETLGPSVVGAKFVYNSVLTYWNTVGYDSNSNKIVVAYKNGANNYGTAVVGTVSGTSIAFGSPVVFNSGDTVVGDIVFDSNSNKIVILYRNNANSFYGTGIVGTVSGDSISFGSPSIFLNSQANEISGVFDTSTNKIAVFYRYVSNGNKGYASVGQVSGTSITFTSLGSQVQFNNDQTLYNSCVFDSNSNKCVVFYRGFPSDQGKARVGTISGLSISFGTEATFNAGRSDRMSAAFDSSSNKCVVSYSEWTDSQKGKCVVGTVSGTSISFGSPVVFETDNSDFRQAMTFNSLRNKIVLAWMGESGGTYTSKVAAGTVSGTSISFDTPLTFSAGYAQNPTIIYDSGSDSSVLAYMDNTNSSYGTAQVFKSVTASTTLTSENFIGVADAAYSDGATAKIQLVGSVDDAQSGLTAGQTYYVQGNNTLSETPADPSVVAGTAVSATKLIVKG